MCAYVFNITTKQTYYVVKHNIYLSINKRHTQLNDDDDDDDDDNNNNNNNAIILKDQLTY